jgi:hypothetical protein
MCWSMLGCIFVRAMTPEGLIDAARAFVCLFGRVQRSVESM